MNIPPKYEDLVFQLNELNKREAALREELAALRESYEAMRDRKNSIVDLQQRLTVAEKRANRLEELLREERRLHYGDETVQETKSRLFGHFGDGV